MMLLSAIRFASTARSSVCGADVVDGAGISQAVSNAAKAVRIEILGFIGILVNFFVVVGVEDCNNGTIIDAVYLLFGP